MTSGRGVGFVGGLWTIDDVAAFLRVPVTTVYDWRYRGNGGPPAYKIGGTLRFDPDDVRQWLADECRERRPA
ncbi:MAG: helix-turn-helix domain-containing protein [Acidimicrobiales bacterium]